MSFNLSVVEMVAAPLLVYIQGYPTIIFSFKRREKTDTAITVNFAISGSAILGTHYTQSGATTYNGTVGTLYFAPGETFKNVFIHPINGADFLTGESLVFSLLEGTGYKPTTLNGTIVYILDKAGSIGPAFSIELNPQIIAEDDTVTKFIFTFSKSGTHSAPLDLNYEVTGTASAVGQPADYTGLSPGPIYTLTFNPEEASKTIEVTVINDSLIEGDETVIVNLLQGVGYKRSFPIQAIGTITDDDDADYIIEFDSPVYYVNENNTVITPIVITRTAGASGTAGVSFVTSNGTATSGADYTYSTSVVTFYNTETIKIVEVPIIEDILIEGDETINLTLLDPFGGAALGPQSTAILTIVDNDINLNGVIQFNSPTYSVYEDGTAVTPITLVRTGGSDGTVGVTVFCDADTATVTADFDATDIIVEFLPGELSKVIAVPIVDDLLEEGNETFILTLGDATGGAVTGAQDTAVVTIIDNDIVVGGPYNFKVLQPSSIEGFGADVDLDLTGYNLIGIINKGSLGYTAIFNLGTVYKFITDLSQFTVDTSSLSSPNFIYSWKGGEGLGAAIYTAPTENTVKDLNGQTGGFPIINAVAEVPMVRFSYWVEGSPYPPFLIEGLGLSGNIVNSFYRPLSPPHTQNYSGSATKITTYTPGGDKTITRAINRVVNYTPSDSININSSGDYTTTFTFDTINNKLYPQEYKLLKLDGTTQSFPGLSQYNQDVWSLNGTSNGSFTSIFATEFNFSGQASYVATGSIDNGANYTVYVNPYSLQELKYINYRLGNWDKTYTTVTTCSGDTFWETVINLAETYNFTSYLYDSELLFETDDTFIASVKYGELEFDYSLNYSGTTSEAQGSGMEDLCFKAEIHLDYPGSNYNLNVNLIDGSGLVPLDVFTASSADFNFKEIYQLSIGDLEYLFSPDYKSFYSWVGSWALPISIVNSSIQVTDLGFTTGAINGITSISCINGRYTNNHTVSAYTPFTLIGQEVLVIYRNGAEYWECEGVISACDEVTIESTDSVIGGYDGQGAPFYYTFDGVYTLECDSLTIDLDLGTQVFNSFFAFSSILSYQPEYYCLVINKNDFTKLVVELLKENNARSLLTMYKIENTVEIAIAQKPIDATAQTEWRADIYRFNTTILKWERRPNGVSALSELSATSQYISYHPTPAV